MAATKKHTGSESDAVKAASKDVRRAEAALDRLLDREKAALAKYDAAKARAKGSNHKRLSDAVLTARQKANESSRLRKEAVANLREARAMLREQKQLARESARKERARERAVAAFVKKWDREYDLEMRRKKQNIELRKQEIRRR